MILVTGGAGFIGSNLVAAYAADGHPVCISDTVEKPAKLRNIDKHDVDTIVRPDQLEAFLERRGEEIELVLHMGAISSTTVTDLELLTATNVVLSQRIWLWCSEHGVPLVYASSGATYGDGSEGFVDDQTDEALAVLRPLNPYGRSKHDFDRWAVAEDAAGRTPPAWYGLKLFNVYGPNEYHKGHMQSLVAKSYPKAVAGARIPLFRSDHPDYPDGGQKRDFVYVDDAVSVVRWMVDHRPPSGLYNVGTGRAQSWLELVTALYAAVGNPLEVEWIDVPEAIRPHYQYYTQADLTKLRAAGYTKPFRSVEEGVTEYVTRYLVADDPHL
ncbi:MAG: ADP-glyceromanno-heptose 6-epimerase [Gemmatimonadota bacterium]